MESTWTAINKKLGDIDEGNIKKLNEIEKKIESVEQSISTKIKEEVKEAKVKIVQEVDIKMKKVGENLATFVEKKVAKLNKDIKVLTDKEVDRDEFEAKMNEFMRKTEAENKQRTSGETPASTSKLHSLSPNTRKIVVTDISNEMKDKKERASNLLVHGSEEHETNSISERDAIDREFIQNIVTGTLEVDLENRDIIYSTRIGAKAKGKKRPIKLTLSSTEKKDEIMSNLFKLRDTEYQNLSFCHDMTKLERERFRALKDEANEIEEKSGGKHRYRVRGPPWDLHIVELPPAVMQMEQEQAAGSPNLRRKATPHLQRKNLSPRERPPRETGRVGGSPR